jgi:lipid-binding SYLF domain-containing protein
MARTVHLSAALLISTVALGGSVAACSRSEPPRVGVSEGVSPQQAIVENSAAAFTHVRKQRGPQVDRFLERARGVMIFPRLIKASLIVGGEGGNGVLVAKGSDGSWSNPAFYSLGAPSVGLQIGYQEASVVLFLMEDSVVQKALHSDFTLGANTSVALGDFDERTEAQGEVLSKPIYQLVEARGAFVGASLDGYVISARNKHNQAYYGAPVTPHSILIERTSVRPEADILLRAFPKPASKAVSLNP